MVTTLRERDRQARGLAGERAEAPPPAAPTSRVLAVASGKGGVGKTNLTANLGISLARRGLRVLVFDGDFGLANVDVLLGLRVTKTLRDVVNGEASLSDIILDGPGGIRVAPGGCGFSEFMNLDGFRRGRLLRELSELERDYDFVLIDVGAGLGPDVVHLLRSVSEALVVTTPEPTALTDAYALIKVASMGSPGPTLSLVMNASRSEQEGRQAAERLQKVAAAFLGLSLPVAAVLPFSEELAKAVRAQVPVVLEYPQCAFSAGVDRLSRHLAGATANEAAPARSGLARFFRGLLRGPGGSLATQN